MKHQNNYSVEDWLRYLEQNKPQEKINLGLKRVKDVASALNLLRIECPVISVAGTNGKGSTIAALESIYFTAGYRVASYTSPHLFAFNERIKINQLAISDASLCCAFSAVFNAPGIENLTYFEVVTIVALWHFKMNPVDIILLEVGLGGRLDATNIIDADLAIITTIDYDHQAYLGDTKEAIGLEKAGILRKKGLLVYGDYTPPKSVLAHAKSLNVTLFKLGTDFYFNVIREKLFLTCAENKPVECQVPSVQVKSAVSAIVASLVLKKRLPIELGTIERAMQTVKIVARQQYIPGTIGTVFDVAHNAQAARSLADFIVSLPKKKVHVVFAALKDKNLIGLIEPLVSHADYWYTAKIGDARAVESSTLASAFDTATGVIPPNFNDPLAAYMAAKKEAFEDDLIIVYGSFLTVNAVMGADYQEDMHEFSNG